MEGYTLPMSVTEIQIAITELPPKELASLVEWIEDYEADAWDRQIETDALAGRLDALAAEADREFEAGRCQIL